jgi:tetratricopeptide (TPR) repeat protein
MRQFAHESSSGRCSLLVLLGFLFFPTSAVGGQSPPVPSGEATPGYYFLVARHLEGTGQVDEAIAALKKASALAPKAAEIQAELAGLYARQNRAVEAVEAAEAGLALDPNNREANRILGSVYAALSEQRQPLRPGEDPATYTTRAVSALEKARRDGQMDVGIELMLGRLYIQAKDYARAIPALRRVVDDQPGYPEAAMLLAAAHESAGQVDQALLVLEATLEQNPTFFRGHVRAAELYEKQRRFKQAADAYAAAQALNPRADLTASHATALINAGQPAEARDRLQAAVAREASPDAALLYLLAQAQRRAGDPVAAAATAKRLKDAHPGDLRGLFLDANLAEEDGRTDDAIAAMKTLIERMPSDPTLVYQYANLLEKDGRVAEAEKALRDLLANDPLDANALNSLGYMFAERRERLDEAVELLQRALKIEPGNPSFLDSLGWAYLQKGQIELADTPLTQAAAGLPRSSVVQDHLGDLRMKQRRLADALAAWERALAGDGEGIDRATIEKKLRDIRERLKK